MKLLNFIFLLSTAMHGLLQTAQTQKEHSQQKYVERLCTLIVYQTFGIKHTGQQPQGPIESILLQETRQDEFCAELPNHTFTQLYVYAPRIHTVLKQQLRGFAKLTPENKTTVCKNVFHRVKKMQQIIRQNEPSAWQLCEPETESWEQNCSPENLAKLKKEHMERKKPDLPTSKHLAQVQPTNIAPLEPKEDEKALLNRPAASWHSDLSCSTM